MNTPHYLTLNDAPVSSMMERIRSMIERKAPLLMRTGGPIQCGNRGRRLNALEAKDFDLRWRNGATPKELAGLYGISHNASLARIAKLRRKGMKQEPNW